MRALKPCPCGKTPNDLVINGVMTDRYMYVTGNCCDEWSVEFRAGYFDPATSSCLLLAIVAWNGAPRGE